jgi:hypothetical protein
LSQRALDDQRDAGPERCAAVVMRRYGGGRVIVVAVIGLLVAAAAAGRAAEPGSGSGSAASRVRLLVHLRGPAPAQQRGALPGAPGGAPAPSGPAGPAPARRGTFLLAGAVRDRGQAVLRLPLLGAGSHESTLLLRGVRGLLSVAMRGGGAATSGGGEGRWRVIGGSGAYTDARGGGTLTQTPEQAVLVGRLVVRGR